MSLLDGIAHRLHVLFRGEAYLREVERELRFHVETAALNDASNEAELAARQQLGSATYYREEVRRMTLLAWIDRIRQDAGYAARGLQRSPGFTAAVVVTLGLGIGVNGAMFSLVDRVFVQPPAAVARPHEIRRLYLEFSGSPNEPRTVISWMQYPQFRAFRAAVDSTIAVAAFTSPDSTSVRVGDLRLPARRSRVTPEYFSALGIRATAGRLFGREESDIAVPTPVAVLSDAFWRRSFNADRGVVGRRVLIGPRPFTIVGVAQPDFTGIDLNAVDVWVPANTAEGDRTMVGPWYNTYGIRFNGFVRLRTAAEEDRVLSVGTRSVRELPDFGLARDSTVRVLSGSIQAALAPGDRPAELTVAARTAGVAAMVLVIACANVTNLLLLRATRRKREIAVRRALGVTRLRLVEQLTVESLLLAGLSAAGAFVFSWWAALALRRLVLPNVYWADSPIDARATAFIIVAAAAVGIVAGALSSLHAMRPDLADSLRAGMHDVSYRGSKLRALLLTVQAALCLVLLVGAGLFIRSLANVQSIDLGYDRSNQHFIRPAFDEPALHETELRTAIPETARRLAAIDGVEAVAYTSTPPFQAIMFRSFYLPGRATPGIPGDIGPSTASVSPGFFKATGLSLEQGRDFTDADRTGAQPVVIVSDIVARTFWPGESAMGKCLILGKRTAPCSVVVGIASDAHRRNVIEAPVGQLFVPIAQMQDTPRDLIVRTRPGRDALVIRAAERMLGSLVTDMVGLRARSFETVLEPQLRPWRLGVTLFTALGGLALVVAAIGVYAVVAYGVSQRRQEMGVRIALGAQASDILDLVMRDGLRIVAVGMAVGVVAALLLGRLVASLLFGVVASDASVLIGATTLLGAVGMVACVIPGWRAARVDPVTALRAD